ncbi:hypothetical protein A6A04_20890 [Paramagnetospirillum marisnigri]|uniref:Uncharacterized protein n=1 Tax=Paramagnetospirillum marisnigri TaxID=1285242 RepID=A0A178M9H4_9PROT|nr:hypothetical protein A6A04_20890 [Paramagnetospirillum marisnigri]
MRNHGNGTAFNSRITFLFDEAHIGGESFKIDEKKKKEFPYSQTFNTIPASPSHVQAGQEACFYRLPTPIAHDYQHKIERMECFALIEYEDAFKNSFKTVQEVRVSVRLAEDVPKVLLTFGEEVVSTERLSALAIENHSSPHAGEMKVSTLIARGLRLFARAFL